MSMPIFTGKGNVMAKNGRTIVIGAGIGGIAAALAASAYGEDVLVIERHSIPGGKARNIFVDNKPIAAGPTVLTMKWVFDRLLALHGKELNELVTAEQAQLLARHSWRDGSRLDLFADIDKSAEEIGAVFGPADSDGYRRLCEDSETIFNILQESYIAAQRPNPLQLMRRIGLFDVKRQMALKPLSAMWSALESYFKDERLRQLYGRYATYCGSSPFQAPATLMLVAHVEQAGVWTIKGGIAALAKSLAQLAVSKGTEFVYNAQVDQILLDGDQVRGVQLLDGTRHDCSRVIYNGDAAALNDITGGRLGNSAISIGQRSLSARTWCIEAEISGFPLAHHSVFFSDNYRKEFNQILQEFRMPDDPTIYICAQDRDSAGARSDNGKKNKSERMLFIVNAAADGDIKTHRENETERCMDITLSTLEAHGMSISRPSLRSIATSPQDFNDLFPHSGGALYGRASHGWTASFKRPGARTKIPGLYQAGGSVHPGPGVPMAALSGMLAAECLAADRALLPRSSPAVTYGGTSTA